MRKISIVAILVFIVVGLVGYRMYNKPPRSAVDEVGIAINAKDLYDTFQKDELAANATYLDKVVVVTGKILALTTNADNKTVITLSAEDPIFGVNCTLDTPATNLTVADTVTIKGICMGYLSDVVVINCLVISK